MSVNYESNDFAQILISNWSLTGVLDIWQHFDPTNVLSSDLVHILAHQQKGSTIWRKAVVVMKISPIEDVVEHPLFDEVRNTYQVWCHYTLASYDGTLWDAVETNIQAIENEVIRILELTYSPKNGLGTFFTTDRKWNNQDNFDDTTKQLNRVLEFTLIKLRPRNTHTIIGYKGVLAIDVSRSQGTLPGTNYAFTEAYSVDADEGWDTIDEVVPGTDRGLGVPVRFLDMFDGFFQCLIYPKTDDFGTDYTVRLNKIFQPITTGVVGLGELPIMYFLQTNYDTESGSHGLTQNTPVKVTRFKIHKDLEGIVQVRLQGKVAQPSLFAVF